MDRIISWVNKREKNIGLKRLKEMLDSNLIHLDTEETKKLLSLANELTSWKMRRLLKKLRKSIAKQRKFIHSWSTIRSFKRLRADKLENPDDDLPPSTGMAHLKVAKYARMLHKEKNIAAKMGKNKSMAGFDSFRNKLPYGLLVVNTCNAINDAQDAPIFSAILFGISAWILILIIKNNLDTDRILSSLENQAKFEV